MTYPNTNDGTEWKRRQQLEYDEEVNGFAHSQHQRSQDLRGLEADLVHTYSTPEPR
jgi:hypothetical protein